MPRNNDNNTIVVNQSTMIPQQCSQPDASVSVIVQHSIDGMANYTIHLMLESDPAALQALDHFIIRITGYMTEVKPAYKFVS